MIMIATEAQNHCFCIFCNSVPSVASRKLRSSIAFIFIAAVSKTITIATETLFFVFICVSVPSVAHKNNS